ncbi:MAG: hypothetical protein WCR42_10830 [bacterium]
MKIILYITLIFTITILVKSKPIEPYLTIQREMHGNDHNQNDLLFFEFDPTGTKEKEVMNTIQSQSFKYFQAEVYFIEKKLIDKIVNKTIGKELIDERTVNTTVYDNSKYFESDFVIFYTGFDNKEKCSYTNKKQLLAFMREYKKVINKRFKNDKKRRKEYNKLINFNINWLVRSRNIKLKNYLGND